MPVIPDAHRKVPMAFRAQVEGRCQLQRLVSKQTSDALQWTDEWTERTYPNAPQFDRDVRVRTYKLSWRFIANDGQDDSIIRPVIGAKGWPFYPGSSMKGTFARACTPAQRDRYCGRKTADNDFEPGLLRFHGGYPTDDRWTDGLLDIAHPQQDRQVKDAAARSSAFAVISLYQPELQFGISSTDPLPEAEWETIWSLWETAIAGGIGGRTCAGYGRPDRVEGKVLYRCRLKGQGQAAKRLDGEGEFRPNGFRAAIRGHALRLFGGLTDADTADRAVNQLFGSVKGSGDVGLLGTNFVASRLEYGSFGQRSYRQPTYRVEGDLSWLLARDLPGDRRQALVDLVQALTRFAVLLGGFGKSWRRADHRLFFEAYGENGNKPLIGTHWQWTGQRSGLRDNRVRKLEKVGPFIDTVRDAARTWLQVSGFRLQETRPAPWREAWHPHAVEVWGRVAETRDDCAAVAWLHGPYQTAMPPHIPEGSIHQSSVTGKVNQIGRLWHRMYPWVRLVKDPADPKRPKLKPTPRYFELLTIFSDSSDKCAAFLGFLDHRPEGFQRLWPPEG